MNLLKNKVFLIVLAVLVLLVIVGAIGFKAFSLYAFNQFSKKLDNENQNLFTGFKTEIETSNKINQNLLNALNFGAGYSKEANTKALNQAKSDYTDSIAEYKKDVEELESKSSEISSFSKMPLWLDGNQKKFAADINSSVDQYVKARKDDYQFSEKTKPVYNNLFQVFGDTIVLVDYAYQVSSAQTATEATTALTTGFASLKPLEKYTDANYKFEGEDELATEFPDSYKAFHVFQATYAQLYLAAEAMSKGDFSKVNELLQIGPAMNQSLTSLQDPISEIGEKSKPYVVKIKDAYVPYAKALDFFAEKNLHSNPISKEKVLTQNNQNKLAIFAYLAQIYQIDKEFYPQESTFSSFVEDLKKENLLGSDVSYKESDFTYSSSDGSYFEIGYTDEVSGKKDVILVGVKQGSTNQALGAATQILSVKVQKHKVDLNFINDATSYLNSLKQSSY